MTIDTRILELSNALLTASQEYIPQPEGEGIPSELIPEEPEVSISVVATAPSGGFHFMQEDELEQTTEENTDWVNVPNDQPEAAAPVIAEVVVAVETVEENGGNEFAPVENGVPEGADVRLVSLSDISLLLSWTSLIPTFAVGFRSYRLGERGRRRRPSFSRRSSRQVRYFLRWCHT